MDKDECIKIINARQDMYVSALINLIINDNLKKEINFNSPTGTGKTIMISKLINNMNKDEYFFLITTLSRGGLNIQVQNSLTKSIKSSNYCVFGVSSFTSSTKLKNDDILNIMPKDKKLIWIRDEGHIKSNNWTRLLEKKAYKIINISATNKQVDIQCNFTDTLMLRTPYQLYGTPEDAIKKLLDIKRIHKDVKNYNPCLIVRDVDGKLADEFYKLSNEYNLKIINITDNDVDIQQLCRNDNPYDVIINKLKITEGIDIPRASVLYIGNKPSNQATVIQLIGRVRRNALLWMNDIDIFSKDNEDLLNETIKTYVYYNKDNSIIPSCNNELSMELSDSISVEQLIPSEVKVVDNYLLNGYKIAELTLLSKPFTGTVKLSHDDNFVTITNIPEIYEKDTKKINEYSTIFKAIVKDPDLVKISFDKAQYFKVNNTASWYISTSVSENIKYGKLLKFINLRYVDELKQIQGEFDTNYKIEQIKSDNPKINKCINYLTKFYFKYLIYGESFFEPFVSISKSQAQMLNVCCDKIDVLFNAISLYYKKIMTDFYGPLIGKMIPNLSLTEITFLSSEIKNYIINMATTAYVKINNIINLNDLNKEVIHSPHLGNPQIMHGVADFVLENYLIQFSFDKTNDKEEIFKALSYHFLSTKRYDLRIDKLIIYNFRTTKVYMINITDKNLSKLKYTPCIKTNNQYLNEMSKELQFNLLKLYYNNYGEDFTLNLLVKNVDKLNNKKIFAYSDSLGNKKQVTQKKLLTDIDKLNTDKIMKYVISTIAPTKDSLAMAIKYNYIELVNNILKVVKPRKQDVEYSIKINNTELFEILIKKAKFEMSYLNLAVKLNNKQIIEQLLNLLNPTKYNANEVIRTQNIEAVKKMIKKIKPTTYNLIVAIKTNNINIVQLLVEKRNSIITPKCIEVANILGNNDIVNLLKSKLNHK